MDLTIEHQNNEKEAKSRFRRVYYRVTAPFYVTTLCAVVMILMCGLSTSSEELRGVCFALSALGIVIVLTGFHFFWRRTRKVFMKSGAFEHPTVIHLTDTYVEGTCGENNYKNEYKVYSDYILLKEHIVLRIQNVLAGGFRRKEFPDGGAEFIRCLEACGVKPASTLKRWGTAWCMLALAVLCVISSMGVIQSKEWTLDKAARTVCLNNLKMIDSCMRGYAENHADKSKPCVFLLLPSLQALKNDGYIEEHESYCPSCMQEYKVVPYSKMPDAVSSDKAPIVIDGIASHYKWPYFPIRRSRVWQTPVLFAAGHISLEEDVHCYMDIYDRYGCFLDETDAETLRKCCEALDSGK